MKKKVIYIINYAPNYRNTFLEELAKYVDLTVISFNGSHVNLKDPEIRTGYKYIELKQKRFFNISLNFKEFSEVAGDYDVVIIGYNLRNPFRLFNLIRKKHLILEGIIYGRSNSFLTRVMRRFVLSQCESVLVYSDIVKDKLEKEIKKPIISFNNTSYSQADIEILPYNTPNGQLNVIWVGRYQERKRLERLVQIAQNDERVNLRLLGPGIKEAIGDVSSYKNIQIYEEAYGNMLTDHFAWSHVILNAGGAGLLVMNAARFARPIVIDKNSFHGPEIQLAKEADQIFIDYTNENEVADTINFLLNNGPVLKDLGLKMADIMSKRFTVEYMAAQYMRAINKETNYK